MIAKDFYLHYYSQLVGGTIKQVVYDNDGFMQIYGLVIEMPNGEHKISWISSDEEGNDAGFLTIEKFKD